ncbi:MAG: hypothetical protein ACFBSE_13930 [Prochloraceae cyanobacterium]
MIASASNTARSYPSCNPLRSPRSALWISEISTADSPSITLIQEISFDGDIVVFASEDLPENLRAGLEDRVTDLLVKPIDWNSLKDKEYLPVNISLMADLRTSTDRVGRPLLRLV